MDPRGKSLTYGTSAAVKTVPYEVAVDAVEASQREVRARECEPAPASIGTLVIEEAFSLLHNGTLYSGMGEEAISAAFASALAAASVMWGRQWIWQEDIGSEQILWNHYNDKSETVLGADFSLILVDKENDELRYRLIVAQAKKHTAEKPSRLHVERKAFSTSKDKPAPANWEKIADAHLTEVLSPRTLADADSVPDAPNWQLTRLLLLRKKLKAKKILATYLYVIWPATPSRNNGRFNEVLYENLSTASIEILRHFRKNKEWLQSFEMDSRKLFRDYLLNYRDIQSMSESDLLKVLGTIKAESAATILINASGSKLAPNLTSQLQLVGLPKYTPATRTTHKNTMRFG